MATDRRGDGASSTRTWDCGYEPDRRAEYECLDCGEVLRTRGHPGGCPRCGSVLRNRTMPIE